MLVEPVGASLRAAPEEVGMTGGKARLPPRWFITSFWRVHRRIVRSSGGRKGLWAPRPGTTPRDAHERRRSSCSSRARRPNEPQMPEGSGMFIDGAARSSERGRKGSPPRASGSHGMTPAVITTTRRSPSASSPGRVWVEEPAVRGPDQEVQVILSALSSFLFGTGRASVGRVPRRRRGVGGLQARAR